MDEDIVEMVEKTRVFFRMIRNGTNALGYYNRDDTDLLQMLQELHDCVKEGYSIILRFEEQNSLIKSTKQVIFKISNFLSRIKEIAQNQVQPTKQAIKAFIDYYNQELDTENLIPNLKNNYTALMNYLETDNFYEINDKVSLFEHITKVHSQIESTNKMNDKAFEESSIAFIKSDAIRYIYRGIDGLITYSNSNDFPIILSEEGKEIKMLKKKIREQENSNLKLKRAIVDLNKKVDNITMDKLNLKSENNMLKKADKENQSRIDQLSNEVIRLKSQNASLSKYQKYMDKAEKYCNLDENDIPEEVIQTIIIKNSQQRKEALALE